MTAPTAKTPTRTALLRRVIGRVTVTQVISIESSFFVDMYRIYIIWITVIIPIMHHVLYDFFRSVLLPLLHSKLFPRFFLFMLRIILLCRLSLVWYWVNSPSDTVAWMGIQTMTTLNQFQGVGMTLSSRQ